MSEELSAGCQRPSSGPAEPEPSITDSSMEEQNKTPEIKKERNIIQVGKKAPDFTAAGFHKNAFVNIKLSEKLGKWVVLCFYPGDFTFV
ncbi:Alkyl hydroperoxide reductase/ Thiol specific antioxidant/ Mal allergen [Desulfamplus magnetovallimortis]|nr:Alkyl hydroperoxide reductase/ Thiol specific antioxidant/ Mal allergen [Desulfamplus magnetovallimortis]